MLKRSFSVVMALGVIAVLAFAGCKSEEDFRLERANYARLHFEQSQFKELPQDVRLTLPECIRLAHENNLDVKVSRLEEAVAHEMRTAELLGMLPEINISNSQDFFCLNSIAIDTLHFSLWNKIIKKSILDRIPEIPNANCWDDLAITSRAIALAQSAMTTNVPFYHYRINTNAGSLTSQAHEKRLHDQLIVARFVEEWFIKNKLDAKYAQFLRNMKFSAKIKFLRGRNRDFAAWKRTFPETNNGILCYRHIPLHYRLLFFMADILPARLCQYISDKISKK